MGTTNSSGAEWDEWDFFETVFLFSVAEDLREIVTLTGTSE